jgi:Tol biopolymer transport system component/DNA-binding winged helix-turn-helix (wHTH) protein
VSSSSQSRPLYCFSLFEVDPGSGELRRNGVRLKVQDQPFHILVKLLEHAGELVTREELRSTLWPADTFVDFDNGLNMAMNRLREVLGDVPERPTFIETVPRHGYRFIAPVEKLSSGAPSERADVSKRRLGRLTAKARWISVGATLLALLSGIGIWRFSRNRVEAPLPPIEVVPLVGLPGFEDSPAFSPDGNQVAFALHGKENSGIYTTVVGGEKSLRLTSNSHDCCPRWSPDGRQVAFPRFTDEGVAIYVIPAFGGTEHRLYSGPVSVFPHSLDWSPDGKVLAFSESQADKTHTWIALLSLVDSTTRRLTSPSGQDLDFGPAFSPDGSTVAFVRGIVAGVVEDLYVVPAAGGAPKRLTFDNCFILGITWTPDGRDIVFSSMREGLASLWRMSASGGTPRPVAGVGVGAVLPSISSKGNQLVYQQVVSNDNIWRVDLRDEKHRQGPAAVVISEKGGKGRPHFSPDGKRIAFESDRLGYPEIWACDSDGSNCGQLTSLRGTAGAARWSPDGHYIAFEFRPKEHSEVYLLEVGGGRPRLLATLPGADNGGPNWSRDGKWIYFYSDRGGGPFQLWKIQLNGGPPVQVTKNGGVFAAESADGRFLYYSKSDVPGIWKMPLSGGEEIRVLDQPAGDDWYNWALARNGIYFLDSSIRTNATVKFFDFATGKKISISTSDKPPSPGLALSPDGRSILYVQNELAESSIMLVKNFQ